MVSCAAPSSLTITTSPDPRKPAVPSQAVSSVVLLVLTPDSHDAAVLELNRRLIMQVSGRDRRID